MSYPEMMAVPLVGEMSPIKMLNVVVLPAPTHTVHREHNEYMYVCICMYMSLGTIQQSFCITKHVMCIFQMRATM